MLKTVQGIYRDGKIELLESPHRITESQVIVTFVTPQPPSISQHLMTFGMFSGTQQSTEANFNGVEFQDDGDNDFNMI